MENVYSEKTFSPHNRVKTPPQKMENGLFRQRILLRPELVARYSNPRKPLGSEKLLATTGQPTVNAHFFHIVVNT